MAAPAPATDDSTGAEVKGEKDGFEWLQESQMKIVPQRGDIIAGFSVAGLLLPEAVTYASIAGLPPQRAQR